MNTSVKMLLSAVAVSALIASPALAKPQHARHTAAPAVSTTVVTVDGKVVGADPDANIRIGILHDYQNGHED
jgi:hypothetical protein